MTHPIEDLASVIQKQTEVNREIVETLRDQKIHNIGEIMILKALVGEVCALQPGARERIEAFIDARTASGNQDEFQQSKEFAKSFLPPKDRPDIS